MTGCCALCVTCSSHKQVLRVLELQRRQADKSSDGNMVVEGRTLKSLSVPELQKLARKQYQSTEGTKDHMIKAVRVQVVLVLVLVPVATAAAYGAWMVTFVCPTARLFARCW